MSSSAPDRVKRTQSWRWLTFFLVLLTLVGVAVTLPIVYNLNQQLRREQFNAARVLWRETGLTDYDLTYSIQYDRELTQERYIVLVREGQVVWASCEGEIIETAPAVGAVLGLPAGANQGRCRDIPAIFDRLEELLREQEETEGRHFLVAVFDPKSGWPRRFIRRIRRSSTREEWNLRLWQAGELERTARR